MDLFSIDHMCLLVSNLEKSKKYYEEFFNFKCKPHPNDKSTLMVESETVHFFIKEDSIPKDILNKQHISFRVSNIEEVIDILHTNGVTHYESGEFTHFRYNNYKWLEWRDLDGIRVECVEWI